MTDLPGCVRVCECSDKLIVDFHLISTCLLASWLDGWLFDVTLIRTYQNDLQNL